MTLGLRVHLKQPVRANTTSRQNGACGCMPMEDVQAVLAGVASGTRLDAFVATQPRGGDIVWDQHLIPARHPRRRATLRR